MSEESEWTPDEIKRLLELAVQADSPERFRGVCVQIGKLCDRDEGAVGRFLWGLANRLVEFVSGIPERRTSLTWTEKKIIIWAACSNTKDDRQKKKPDPEYIAKLIGRPLDQVEEAWKQLGPARGREGFNL